MRRTTIKRMGKAVLGLNPETGKITIDVPQGSLLVKLVAALASQRGANMVADKPLWRGLRRFSKMRNSSD